MDTLPLQTPQRCGHFLPGPFVFHIVSLEWTPRYCEHFLSDPRLSTLPRFYYYTKLIKSFHINQPLRVEVRAGQIFVSQLNRIVLNSQLAGCRIYAPQSHIQQLSIGSLYKPDFAEKNLTQNVKFILYVLTDFNPQGPFKNQLSTQKLFLGCRSRTRTLYKQLVLVDQRLGKPNPRNALTEITLLQNCWRESLLCETIGPK